MGGIRRDRIVLDPGFGFGKGYQGDYALLRRFHEFQELRFPLLVGVSRKSSIGRALSQNGKEPDTTDRLFGTLGAEVAAALKGAHVIRTHDVKSCAQALVLADLVTD